MAYFLILPAWILAIFAMAVVTLCTRFVEPMKSWYPFAWRILLWSSIGFLSTNVVMLAFFLIPSLAGGDIFTAPNVAKYGFVAFLLIGPVIASAVGFFGGIALGIWLSIRAKVKSAPNLSFNPALATSGQADQLLPLACIAHSVQKLLIYLLIVVLAIFVAGLYGVAHNQISYTVAPEYFTKFKFRQFGFIDTPLPERVRASMIGFLASWWMGIPIGLLVGAAGFIHCGHRRMLRVSLWSLLVTVGFTLLFSLGGLLYGYFQTAHIDVAEYRGWYIPDDLTDLRRFLCAGYMHNSSYLGGVFAILIAWAFHIIVRVRTKDAS